MFFYGVTPAATQTTSGTPSTETVASSIIAGTGRVTYLSQITLHGLGAGLTTLSGILGRLRRFTTASTSGTAITPAPRSLVAPASKCTAASGATAGSGGALNQLTLSAGGAGPGAWQAEKDDAMPELESGSGDSLDVFVQSGTASMVYTTGITVQE